MSGYHKLNMMKLTFFKIMCIALLKLMYVYILGCISPTIYWLWWLQWLNNLYNNNNIDYDSHLSLKKILWTWMGCSINLLPYGPGNFRHDNDNYIRSPWSKGLGYFRLKDIPLKHFRLQNIILTERSSFSS